MVPIAQEIPKKKINIARLMIERRQDRGKER